MYTYYCCYVRLSYLVILTQTRFFFLNLTRLFSCLPQSCFMGVTGKWPIQSSGMTVCCTHNVHWIVATWEMSHVQTNQRCRGFTESYESYLSSAFVATFAGIKLFLFFVCLMNGSTGSMQVLPLLNSCCHSILERSSQPQMLRWFCSANGETRLQQHRQQRGEHEVSFPHRD